MVTQRNLEPIVARLMEHIETAEGTYRQELVNKILTICSKERYGNIGNCMVHYYFWCWQQTIYGEEISKNLTDVVTRVEDVRAFAVRCMVPVLMDGGLMTDRASSRGAVGSTFCLQRRGSLVSTASCSCQGESERCFCAWQRNYP